MEPLFTAVYQKVPEGYVGLVLEANRTLVEEQLVGAESSFGRGHPLGLREPCESEALHVLGEHTVGRHESVLGRFWKGVQRVESDC